MKPRRSNPGKGTTPKAMSSVRLLQAKVAMLEERLAKADQQIEKRVGLVEPANNQNRNPACNTAPSSSAGVHRSESYRSTITRIRDMVEKSIPSQSIVLVVSRGDGELLSLGSRHGWHFPQNAQGVYLGHHPADSATAIKQVEALRARGAQYLLFPATALWWLQHYAEFRLHLEQRYPTIASEDQSCRIFDLQSGSPPKVPAAQDTNDLPEMALTSRGARWFVECLLPENAPIAILSTEGRIPDFGSRKTFRLPESSLVESAFGPSSSGIIAELDVLRDKGAQFLVILHAAGARSEYGKELTLPRAADCQLVTEQPNVCSIFEL